MAFLTPQDRSLLLDSLRPPPGYELDVAIGTTYSLDLLALMVAPIGFTLFEFDAAGPDEREGDPLAIMEAVRRHASQIVLFCEAGRIAVPRHYPHVLAFLEKQIVQVRAPTPGCAFHPKVWMLRYVQSKEPVLYRLLCLSRNLTFDRSWDTMLVLDGALRDDRSVGFGINTPLRKFADALPSMAVGTVSKEIRRQVATVAGEIGRVEWDLTDLPYESINFWALGYDERKRWPFESSTREYERSVVVSPFAGSEMLARFAQESRECTLVSRTECLDTIDAGVLDSFEDVYSLLPASEIGDVIDPASTLGAEVPLHELHAKLYVADDGWDAHTWTGSANATKRAFSGNVEFMVQLTGKKSKVGVAEFLRKVKGTSSFADLIRLYQRPEKPDIPDEELVALEQELDQLRLEIASRDWAVTATAQTDADQYELRITTARKLPAWKKDTSVTCRLLSAGAVSAVSLESATRVDAPAGVAAIEAMTSFVAIEASVSRGGKSRDVRFVVNAALHGAPENRRERLLRHMLRDQRSVIRFLLLLMSDAGGDLGPPPDSAHGGAYGPWSPDGSSEALLEALLRTLDRNPTRLRAVESLLKELGDDENADALIPAGLRELFDAVWNAREEARAP